MSTLEEKMPAKLARLPELANNLWWSWNEEARDLFRRIDYALWRASNHNPVRMLKELTPEQLERAAADPIINRQYNKVLMIFDEAMQTRKTWFELTYPDQADRCIAYFSFEFGIHNSLPIYSGGLGILAGDHTKEASDLGVPLIGIGFMYPQGYFRQRLPSHGWQEAVYQQLDMNKAPIAPVTIDGENELRISVRIGDRDVWARIWLVRVGRTRLYLLDSDVDENDPWNRELSARLYSGDSEMRLRQEILLGIGGVRALRAMNVVPAVWHMNEGHSAFLTLELMREMVAAGSTFEEALAAVKRESIFTTHTPVPAGHDAFSFHQMETYFAGFWDATGNQSRDLPGAGPPRRELGHRLQHDRARPAHHRAGQRRQPAAR